MRKFEFDDIKGLIMGAEKTPANDLPTCLRTIKERMDSGDAVDFATTFHSFFKYPQDFETAFAEFTDEDLQEIEESWEYNLHLLKLLRRGLDEGNLLSLVAPILNCSTGAILTEEEEEDEEMDDEEMDEDEMELEDVE